MALVVVRLKRGEVKAALEVAEKVAKAESKSPATHNLLGVTRLAAGDRTGARAAYRKALEVDKAFLPAELNLCRLDLAEGNIAAARGRMQGVLKARPNNAQAMLEMALVEEAAGRAEDALRWLEKLHALDRRNVVATTRLVDSLIRAGKADKALEVAKETIGVAPEDLAALAALGQAYLALGDAKQAQVAFGRMTRLAAFDTGWQYRIAQYQVSAGNPDGATYSLERVLANQPDHLPAQVLLAEVELRRGQFDKAEQRARTLAGSQSTEAVGYRLLGDIALAQGRGSDAVASYRAALDRQSDPGVAVRLYQAYFAAGQSSAGLEFMQVWSQKYPKDALAAKALAEGYLRVGNLTAARSSYEALLKQQPDNPELLNNLASVLARQGDPRALELAERAHALAPNDAAVQDTLGWLLVRAGKLETGLRHLREARLRAPQNPEIRYHLAAALAEVGRKEEARAELDEALKIPVALEDTEAVRRLQQRLTSP
jgi:putative PEP-CTERM system TPR-repeat lipoprotein